MKIKTREKQIEIFFLGIPIFLFFVYPFLWKESIVLIYFYLAILFIILFFSFKAIKLIINEEKLDLNRLIKSYYIFFVIYFLSFITTASIHYIIFILESGEV
ncbi:MAG: hypothetical protein KQ78_01637 [Candidatus Izimaplasma bacterium HR2]|nr:MAG: hypothetical protein KQ78_01637 [Candidatus Izimaplasma bacterium HR2]